MSAAPFLFALLALLASAASAQPLAEQRWVSFGATPSSAVVTWTSNTTAGGVAWSATPGACPGGAGCMDGAKALLQSYASPGGGKGIFGTLPAYTSGVIHRATLSGLPVGARVYYRVGSAALGWSDERSFRTHPGVGADVPVTLLVLADLDFDCYAAATGKECDAPAVVGRAVQPLVQDAVNGGGIILGDLAYANGNNSHWDAWQRFFEPLSSTMPVMCNAGNHETAGGENFVPFKSRFAAMPYESKYVDSGALFYSYDVGGVHMVVLSAYSDTSATSPQTVFLTTDLAAVNRTRTPWVVCVWHPPVYNVSGG